MGQALKTLNPELSALARFGAELRSARLALGLSQAQLADLVFVSGDLICKVEKAIRWPSAELADRCDRELGTGGRLAQLWPDLALERRHHRRLRLIASIEASLPAAVRSSRHLVLAAARPDG